MLYTKSPMRYDSQIFLLYNVVFLDNSSSYNIVFVDQVNPDYLLNYFTTL